MAARKSAGVFVSWPKPIFHHTVKTNKNFIHYYNGALMYAHYELTANELKKEVVKYLKLKDPKHPFLDKIKDMHENRFATIGKYMYILNHGGDLPENVLVRIEPFLEKVIGEEEAKIKKEKEEQAYLDSKTGSSSIVDTVTKVVPTIQDRLREKAHEAAGEVEGWLDEFCLDKKLPVKTVQEFSNLFKALDLKTPHARLIYSFFERRGEEIDRAAEGKDKDLSEAYSNFTKSELKKLGTFYSNLLSACTMMQEVAKVVRAPKKKKPVSQDKLVSKIKYKKEDTALGVVSLNPVQILGAKEVWTYNTKTRKISRFVADDVQGPLSVKGTSLIGYNESKSVSKNLRKPAEQLAEFKKAGKVQLRTFMDGIKAVEIKANGRMNEDIIILKILT